MRDVRVVKGTFLWEWWCYKNDWPQRMGWSLTRKGALRAGQRAFRQEDARDLKIKADRVKRAQAKEERVPYIG